MPKQQVAVITSIPWTNTNMPIAAPAVLKPIAEKAGYITYAFDLNQELTQLDDNFELKIPEYNRKSPFILSETDISNFDKDLNTEFYFDGKVNPEYITSIYRIIEYATNRILDYNPDVVCLSLFSYSSQEACRWISFNIKRHNPSIKIIIGGPGLFSTLESNNGIENFANILLEDNTIDYYIRGDGEQALYELLTGNTTFPGINSDQWLPIDDLNKLPYSNYDNYNFELYENPAIGLVGSRGCVWRCTFCDIHQHWRKFKQRTAEHIFHEMLYQNDQTGLRNFKFQDSLINGNNKVYKQLMDLLAIYNESNPKNSLHWSSFFVFRPKKYMSEEEWYITSKSAHVLSVGVESLVESVRLHMGKRFNNEDLYYNLDMAKKYNVKISMLLLVGYVTDTEKTHQESIRWFNKNKHYANNPIVRVSVGGTLGILPNTYLEKNKSELGIIMTENISFCQDWELENTQSTPVIRLRWANELIKALNDAGFAGLERLDNHLIMEYLITRDKNG